MTVRYGRTFEKAFDDLPPGRQDAATDAVETTLRCLGEKTGHPAGLRLKKLRGEYWEVRSTLADRILFERSGATVTFKLVGDHNDIRRFLRRQ